MRRGEEPAEAHTQVVDAPAGFENWKGCTLAGYLKPDDEGVEWCRQGARDTSRAEADKTTRLRARWKKWVLNRFEDNAIQGTDLFVLPRGCIGAGIGFDEAGLRKRYMKLSMMLHPDKNGALPRFAAAFKRLEDEYGKLSGEPAGSDRRGRSVGWQAAG